MADKSTSRSGRGATGSAPKPEKQRFKAIRQLKQAYVLGRRGDPKLPWVLLAVGLGTLAFMVGLGFVLKAPVFFGLLGIPVALGATTFVFGRRVDKSVYKQMEGTPGAAYAALGRLRRGFSTEQEPIAVNRNGDLIFRVVGKCGVVLVSEGPSSRVQHMLRGEKKKYERVLGDLPVHEIQAGNDPGQVPLPKLAATIMKLPRTLRGPQMTELHNRLRALSVTQNALPIPKGPLPKGIKVPRPPQADPARRHCLRATGPPPAVVRHGRTDRRPAAERLSAPPRRLRGSRAAAAQVRVGHVARAPRDRRGRVRRRRRRR